MSFDYPEELAINKNKEIIKISVGFAFRYWTSLDGTRQPSTGHTAAPTGQMAPIPSPDGGNTVDAAAAAQARNFPDNAQGTTRLGWYF